MKNNNDNIKYPEQSKYWRGNHYRQSSSCIMNPICSSHNTCQCKITTCCKHRTNKSTWFLPLLPICFQLPKGIQGRFEANLKVKMHHINEILNKKSLRALEILNEKSLRREIALREAHLCLIPKQLRIQYPKHLLLLPWPSLQVFRLLYRQASLPFHPHFGRHFPRTLGLLPSPAVV